MNFQNLIKKYKPIMIKSFLAFLISVILFIIIKNAINIELIFVALVFIGLFSISYFLLEIKSKGYSNVFKLSSLLFFSLATALILSFILKNHLNFKIYGGYSYEYKHSLSRYYSVLREKDKLMPQLRYEIKNLTNSINAKKEIAQHYEKEIQGFVCSYKKLKNDELNISYCIKDRYGLPADFRCNLTTLTPKSVLENKKRKLETGFSNAFNIPTKEVPEILNYLFKECTTHLYCSGINHSYTYNPKNNSKPMSGLEMYFESRKKKTFTWGVDHCSSKHLGEKLNPAHELAKEIKEYDALEVKLQDLNKKIDYYNNFSWEKYNKRIIDIALKALIFILTVIALHSIIYYGLIPFGKFVFKCFKKV